MKKWIISVFVSSSLLLGGCSILSDAQDTVTYLNEVSGFLTKATEFANKTPELAQDAVTDIQSAEELKGTLEDLKKEIAAFNELQAPEFAETLHEKLVTNNEAVVQQIEEYLNHFKDGKLDPAILENTELFQDIQEIASIINQIKELGE